MTDNETPLPAPASKTPRWLLLFWLVVVLTIAGGLRLANLTGHGFGNMYYAAAVRSMSLNGCNFFYGSFDPEGFITVDKPPLGLWPQVLSVWLLGYNGLALHLPQVLFGLLAVVLVFWLTLRLVGLGGALVAGLVLAVMPVSVAVDRSNLLDSCLTLLVLLAVLAWLRAVSSGYWRWLLLTALLVGVAFNVKMLAAFVILPTLYIVYLFGGPGGWKRRTGQLVITSVVLFAVALSWPVYVDMQPATERPYVGGSHNNSVVELALGYNGLARILHLRPPGPDGSPDGPPGSRAGRPGPHGPGAGPPGMGPPGHGPHGGISGFGGARGWDRLTNRELAGHAAWLFPLVIVGAGTALLGTWSQPTSRPIRTTVLVCLGWATTCAAVFSFSSGIVHNYYLVLMAPPVAILAGLGVAGLHQVLRRGGAWTLLPVLTLAATAAWQAYFIDRDTDWQTWLVPIVACGAAFGSLILLTTWDSPPRVARRTWGLSVGVATLLVCPAIWSATVMLAPGARMVPIADPTLLDGPTHGQMSLDRLGHGPRGGDIALQPLIEFLTANHNDERFVLAVPDIHYAAPIIIKTGLPVMALGGFNGQDQVFTPETFDRAVSEGTVRYVLLGGGRGPGPPRNTTLETWVRQHGHPVPAESWRQPAPERDDPRPAGWPEIIGRLLPPRPPGRGVQLYDCRPTATVDRSYSGAPRTRQYRGN